jgi:heat-inducible transcriptional repressor
MSKFEIIPMDANNFAMVMISSGGSVKTKKVKTLSPIPDGAIEHLASLLNSELCGLGADVITLPIIMRLEAEMGDAAFLVNPAVKCIYEVMNEIDGGEMKLSGINHLLKYPEYSDTEELGKLLGTLESQEEILDLVSTSETDDINVLIGSESSVKVMNNSSLVFTPIKKNGRTVGVIGVLGPRRMNYKQVLQTLGDIGGSISFMMDEERQLAPGNSKEGDNDGRK